MTDEIDTINCHVVERSLVDVTILVAVSVTGKIDCIEYCNYNVQSKLKAEKFKAEKMQSGNEWSFCYLKAKIPLPVLFAESENYHGGNL
jgi:hypothetical protein